MALEGQSRAWHLYGAARDLDPQVRRYRAEACFEHPRLLELVIREAYGAKGPASRRADAWRVLDDIDHRRPLIGALARFFRVGPAATRALRHWRPASLQYWLAYPSARRLSSMLVVLPTNDRRDLDERELWRWLLVAHVFIRCTGVTTEYVMRGEILDGIERLLSARPSGRVALHRTMRRAIRWLRQERREHGGFPRPSRLLAAIGVPAPQPAVLNFCFLLPDGWLGARLDTQEAIREEGAAMHHCLGRYVKDVMRGEVNAYTLRSSDGTERATLVTRHWPFNDDEDMALHITLKAFDNGPVHIGALEATLALIRMVAPATTRVEF